MSVILFVLGILVTGAGIVAIGFGIPINEFNLGYTLIVSGTTAFAAGLILIGLAAAVDQLNQIVLALRPHAGARPGPQPQAAEPAVSGAVRPIPQASSQAPGQAPSQVPVPAKAAMPAPPRNPVLAKAKVEDRPLPSLAEAVAEASPSAIERLRSSMGRPDRKAGDASDTGEVPYASGAQAPPAGPGMGADIGPEMGPNIGPNTSLNGAAATGGPGAAPANKRPPLDFLFRAKSREPQPEAFDAVWPRRAARRPDEPADADEPARPATDEVPINRPYPDTPPSSSTGEMRPAAILKSGVVDGMAYTLYADGSIEAQLPQGTVRFGSIAELRSHIENSA